MSVRYNKHRTGWKKFIGGKRFYSRSGMEQDTWALLVAALDARWAAIKAIGGTDWTTDDIDQVYKAVDVSRHGKREIPLSVSRTVLVEAEATSAGLLTKPRLHASVEPYLETLKLLVGIEFGIDQFEKMKQHVRRIKTLMQNMPVEKIEYDDLVRLKSAILKLVKKNGDPYSVDTIKTIVGCLKTFFNFLADSGKWSAPRGFDRALKVNWSKLSGEREDDNDEATDLNPPEKDAFSSEELAHLWKIGTARGRTILGLGLF